MMYGKRAEVKRKYKGVERFPDFPPRGDPLNILYLYRPSYIYALEAYMGDFETTIVMGEVPVGRTPGQSAGIRIVDFLIADNVDRALIIEQMGYAIERNGKPPDFALDVAPLKAEDADYTEKRRDYAAYGIVEYWRFDPSGGDLYDAALAGERLVDGAYQPIEVEWLDENRCRGYSEFLGLYVCWEYGELRWYNPRTGSYIRTHAEDAERARQAEIERVLAKVERAGTEAERRELEAEAERLRAQAERDRKATARILAQMEREREAVLRGAAEAGMYFA